MKGKTALIEVLAVGFLVSYAVEFLQFYIPTRDSGWNDTISNATGAVAGYFLFVHSGQVILRLLSKWEDKLESLLSVRRACGALTAYFALFFAFSVILQKQTRLSNWDPRCALVIGNDASGENAWKGRVFRLQIWDRALPQRVAEKLTGGGADVAGSETGLVASYTLSGTGPYRDQSDHLPALTWMPDTPSVSDPQAAKLDGKSWLMTRSPAADLTRKIQTTSQFSVRIVCAPAGIARSVGRIVSLSQSAGNVNLHLRQEGKTLIAYFRNPLTDKRPGLAWFLPDLFEDGQVRDILWSYNGSDAFVYVDGRRLPQVYQLSPGVSLMHAIHFDRALRTGFLEADTVLYEIMLFLPAGLLLGLAGRKRSMASHSGNGLLALGVLAPPVILELLLCWVSGRGISIQNIFVSLLLTVAAVLLINADRPLAARHIQSL